MDPIHFFWAQRFGVPAMSTACLGTIVKPWRHCCPPVARKTKNRSLAIPTERVHITSYLAFAFLCNWSLCCFSICIVVQQWRPVQRSRLSMTVHVIYIWCTNWRRASLKKKPLLRMRLDTVKPVSHNLLWATARCGSAICYLESRNWTKLGFDNEIITILCKT